MAVPPFPMASPVGVLSRPKETVSTTEGEGDPAATSESVPLAVLATQRSPVASSTLTAVGVVPTATVPTTAGVAWVKSTSETSFVAVSAAQSSVPLALTARAVGPERDPSEMVWMTVGGVLVASISEIVPS